jgi:hypothetical protein
MSIASKNESMLGKQLGIVEIVNYKVRQIMSNQHNRIYEHFGWIGNILSNICDSY